MHRAHIRVTEIVATTDLLQFDQLKARLTRYDKSVVSHRAGCVDLSLPMPAVPIVALSDPTCPTLTLLDELRARRWTHKAKLQIHDGSNLKHFDSRNVASVELACP